MPFTADFFTANRSALLDSLPSGSLILVAANGRMQRNRDNNYPFRQDSNFWYLSGIDEPDCMLVITEASSFIIAPQKSASQQIFDGSIDTQTLKTQSGVGEVLDSSSGWRQIRKLAKQSKTIATVVTPPGAKFHGMFRNPAHAKLVGRLKSQLKIADPHDISEELARLRQRKQPPEIEALRKASEITAKTLNLVSSQLRRYDQEHQIEAELSAAYIRQNATHGYAPIVASGANACTLHYIKNQYPIKQNAFLLVDTGAEYCNYSADITRTYPIGEPNKRHQEVYQAVKTVHAYALTLLKAGILLPDFEQQVRQHMAKQLVSLGLVSSPADKRVNLYFPHSTSHFLGLDVHDVGIYSEPLPSGTVLTVEPGIYIPDEEIGIRIEDDIMITADGIENLTAACKIPKLQ